MAPTSRAALPDAAHCIVPDRIYFWPGGVATHEGYIYFHQTDSLHYESFCNDFGPFNLAMTHRFLTRFSEFVRESHATGEPLVFLAPEDPCERANAAVLIGISAMVLLEVPPEELARAFDAVDLITFHDATFLPCNYALTVADVIHGVAQGILHGFVDFTTFSIIDYEYYERVEHGDFNWIVPGKFLSFAGPHNVRHIDKGYPHFAPEDFFRYFRKYNVTDIVRLNAPKYERSKFTRNGFRHHDLFFPDGTTPPEDKRVKFLHACETAEGAIAVHCKAGLGRTGTLIGCYLMKHHRMTANEAIAWLRVARPGSVIGPQQQYLAHYQDLMWEQGEECSVRKTFEQRPRWLRVMAAIARGGTAEDVPLTAEQESPSPAVANTASMATAAPSTAESSSEMADGKATEPQQPQAAMADRARRSKVRSASTSCVPSPSSKPHRSQAMQHQEVTATSSERPPAPPLGVAKSADSAISVADGSMGHDGALLADAADVDGDENTALNFSQPVDLLAQSLNGGTQGDMLTRRKAIAQQEQQRRAKLLQEQQQQQQQSYDEQLARDLPTHIAPHIDQLKTPTKPASSSSSSPQNRRMQPRNLANSMTS